MAWLESPLRSIQIPTEILEVAAEIADGSDVLGLEMSRLEHLVSAVISMDRVHRDEVLKCPPLSP